MAKFYQFTPAELYAQASATSAPEAETSEANNYPEALLLFAGNLYRYGLRTRKFHAAQLGIAPADLKGMVTALTGVAYHQFEVQFMLLLIKDVLGDNVPRGTLEAKARRLGFSPSGLYRFMQRWLKQTPTGRVWDVYR